MRCLWYWCCGMTASSSLIGTVSSRYDQLCNNFSNGGKLRNHLIWICLSFFFSCDFFVVSLVNEALLEQKQNLVCLEKDPFCMFQLILNILLDICSTFFSLFFVFLFCFCCLGVFLVIFLYCSFHYFDYSVWTGGSKSQAEVAEGRLGIFQSPAQNFGATGSQK